jgi:hypothetical protein
MDHAELRVWADEHLVWEGRLGDEVLATDGPVGLRSDNGVFHVWFTAGSGALATVAAPQCEHETEE